MCHCALLEHTVCPKPLALTSFHSEGRMRFNPDQCLHPVQAQTRKAFAVKRGKGMGLRDLFELVMELLRCSEVS